MYVGASDFFLSAVLHQWTECDLQPLNFFHANCQIQKKKYSMYDRELLAAYSAINQFCSMLESHNFTLYHKPLTYAFSQKREDQTIDNDL